MIGQLKCRANEDVNGAFSRSSSRFVMGRIMLLML